MLRFAILAWSMLMLGLAAPADAALLQFTISGSDTNAELTPAVFASFQLDSTPTISPVNVAPDAGFAIADVPGTFQYGETVQTTPQPINFFHANQGGGLAIGLDLFLLLDGPQLYTGPEATPTFRTGDFTLTTFAYGSPISMKITQVAAVPEPASWAMMLTGFGLVGGMMRYRRRTNTAAHA
jgi:hypothetical protein